MTPSKLKKLFVLNHSTGEIYWASSGKLAGWPDKGKRSTYWRVKIAGKCYLRSRIVYAISTGRSPRNFIDHINGITMDDRPVNLREADQTQNARNRLQRKPTKYGLPMGVKLTYHGRYNPRITVNKKQISLGCYGTVEEAHAVYLAKRKELFGEFA